MFFRWKKNSGSVGTVAVGYLLIPDVSKRITYYPRIRGEDKMVRLLKPKT